ncbi:TfoX/Sxy family protein [Chelatococcus sp. GCM10030263]|uniref:TfoX/Sxy family protein n=1 Tax=Chelatococcus sp. GCM10030263 TaxID=3273387 RepID=UPI00360B7F6B
MTLDAEALADIFGDFGPVHTRRMFSGTGIYRDDVMFAIEVGGTIYLKTDAMSRAAFEEVGARPFSYGRRDGRVVLTSLWSMPEQALDDPTVAAGWAERAWQAASAKRAAARTGRRRKGRAAPHPPADPEGN